MDLMDRSENVGNFSQPRVEQFYDWALDRQEGTPQVCAFPVPTDDNNSIREQSKYCHPETKQEFIDFCKEHSGLWRYQLYAGVNTNSTVPDWGRGTIDTIDRVNILPFDIETQRGSYKGSKKTDVYWSYAYGIAITKYIGEKYSAWPMVVMSENGIHLHYRVDFDINDDLLYNKQHKYSKFLTHEAWNSDYVEKVKEKAPKDIKFSPDDVSDPPRVMKVPGTKGIKSNNGRLCGIIHAPNESESGEITEDDLNTDHVERFIELVEEEQNKNEHSLNPKKYELHDNLEEKIDHLCSVDSVFKALWNGKTLHYDSRSEAEMAFVLKMMGRGIHPDEVPDVMSKSGMSKWNQDTDHYRERTLENAMSQFDGNMTKDSTDSVLDFNTV